MLRREDAEAVVDHRPSECDESCEELLDAGGASAESESSRLPHREVADGVDPSSPFSPPTPSSSTVVDEATHQCPRADARLEGGSRLQTHWHVYAVRRLQHLCHCSDQLICIGNVEIDKLVRPDSSDVIGRAAVSINMEGSRVPH